MYMALLVKWQVCGLIYKCVAERKGGRGKIVTTDSYPIGNA